MEEGALVEVKGIFSNGAFLASKIEVTVDEGPAGAPEIEIEGVIQAVQTNAEGRVTSITINGVEVAIDATAEIEGDLVVGEEVEIKATVSQGTLQAYEVEIEESEPGEDESPKFEFEGLVQEINRDQSGAIVSIVVDGRTVVVETATIVKGTLDVGSKVKVEGIISGNNLVAARIKSEQDTDNDEPVTVSSEASDDEKDDNKDTDTGEEQIKLKFEGTVASFNSTELVLEDSTSLVINQDTEISGTLSIGVEVRVEATMSGGKLIATKIDVR